ncbi:basigin [Tribolium madens]|uniref:basigin n=1 Tax=Tribolium madens TaxID=41895 RepID=UPI001CF71FE2|nr:basigin [Tribolium madens]
MKYHHLVLLCFALISIFCTKSAYSKVTVLNQAGEPIKRTIHFTVKKSLQLKCESDEIGNITWEKGGKSVEKLDELKGRYELKDNKTILIFKNLKDSDVGNYTCAVNNNGNKIAHYTVSLHTATSSKWGVRVSKNSNVVEGEKLTIKCEIRGDLTLNWLYKNTTSGDNYTTIPDEKGRVKLKDYYDEERKVNVTGGLLIIEEVDMGDRGEYICIGKSADGQQYNMTSTVRIKDKYAALWPFLGICAEVFVLCAIIFIYEKKRNKTELEESDTDQSPEQKNTPDHGKETNLRHRQ